MPTANQAAAPPADDVRTTAFRNYFYRQLTKLRDQAELTDHQRALGLRRLILDLFERATERDRLHFSTQFARVSYAAHKFGIPNVHIFQERRFRRTRPAGLSAEELVDHLTTGYRVATELIRAIFGGAVPEDWVGYLTLPYPVPYAKPVRKGFWEQLRVLAVEIDEEEQLLYVREEERSERVYAIAFDRERVANDHVAEAITIVRRVAGVPCLLNLLAAELRDDDLLYPRQLVVEPDFLIDVTAVAESFSGNRKYQPWSGLAKRLVPFRSSPALVRGNLVNDFLDALIDDPTVGFPTLVRGIFQRQPLALSLFNDQEARKLMTELKHHFTTLQKFVREELTGINMNPETVLLEPSFFSPTYGVQGRLDLLQPADENGQTTIVELKTSKYWNTNVHGLNHTNYIQTLLYDLMINRAEGEGANVRSYILYSNDYQNGLKYAPPEPQQKLEAIAARNQLMGVELLLAKIGTDRSVSLESQTTRLLTRLDPVRTPNLGGFAKQDHDLALKVYGQLSELERAYFGAFLGFTAREQRLAKTGEQLLEGANGLASLWLDDRADKIERFELLDGLTFAAYDKATSHLTLNRPAGVDYLVKFRLGDIVALYATPDPTARPGDVLKSQVLKSTIIAIDPERVVLQLRSRQLTDGVFRGSRHWAIEKDVLDGSFRNFYQGLFAWASTAPDFRGRWLGLRPPAQAEPYPENISPELTDQQNRILRRIVTAPDYFLLWGPPGTGKTSKMLHHLVRHLLENTGENLLLIAYTNRAVDEICESIERILVGGEPFRDYLRIGSSSGVGPAFTRQLLQVRSAEYNKRSELKALIERTRVVVSTVASVGGKGELFALKSFDRIIVDEASQILEPLLAGILPRAPRALLIGDHRQLPAVVQQSPEDTRVYDPALRAIGLRDLSTSLFERLYLTAQAREWTWAYDQLSYQGRMHADIMAFPAASFYHGKLNILPEGIAYRQTQLEQLDFTSPVASGLTGVSPATAPESDLLTTLRANRLVFLATDADHAEADPKVNGHEARLLVDLIGAYTRLYADTARPIAPGDIGIITPYRAQIAHVRRHLQAAGLRPDDYQVDTVERYQGGAKRIVLISLCTNEHHQIRALSQVSEEGVDRKLNVAMTRAREHLVILGCPDILRQSKVYAELLDFCAAPDSSRGVPLGRAGAE